MSENNIVLTGEASVRVDSPTVLDISARDYIRRDLVKFNININPMTTLGVLEVGMDDHIRLHKVDAATLVVTELVFDLSFGEITAYRSDRAAQISIHKGLVNNYTINFDSTRGQQYSSLNLSPIFTDIDINNSPESMATWWLYLLKSHHVGVKDSKKDIILLRIFVYPLLFIVCGIILLLIIGDMLSVLA